MMNYTTTSIHPWLGPIENDGSDWQPNHIHPTARIGAEVILGRYNEIGERVVIDGRVTLGDCNRIEADARILAGEGQITLGDWGVIHNHSYLGGGGRMDIGHNLWLGQMVWLDATGGLRLGHGVRIGTASHVWTHAATAEQLEGGLYHLAPTVLEDDVWLVGDTVTVNPGVKMSARSVALAHSVVTHDTQSGKTYAGAPAREIPLPFWRQVSREQKWQMMWVWVDEFCQRSNLSFRIEERGGRIEIRRSLELLVIGFDVLAQAQAPSASSGQAQPEYTTLFDLTTKRYTKRLTQLEREFYRFLYGNKARFIPA